MNNKNNLLLISALLLTACGGGSSSGDSDSSTPDTDSPVITDTDRDGDGVVNDADYLPDNPYISGAVVVEANLDYFLGNRTAEFSYTLGVAPAGLTSSSQLSVSNISDYIHSYPFITNGQLLSFESRSNSTGSMEETGSVSRNDANLVTRISISDESGNNVSVEEWEYNSSGQLTRQTEENDSGSLLWQQDYDYSAANQLATRDYDHLNNDVLDRTFTYGYTVEGYLSDISESRNFTVLAYVAYTYDASGNLTSYARDIGHNGVNDNYEVYDAQGRIIDRYVGYDAGSFNRHIHFDYRPDGQPESQTYDCNGNTETDQTLSFSYDSDLLSRISFYTGATLDWYADIRHEAQKLTLISLKSAAGVLQQTTRYQYNSEGRVSQRLRDEEASGTEVFTHKYSYLGTIAALPDVDVLSDIEFDICSEL